MKTSVLADWMATHILPATVEKFSATGFFY
jgi:hypothetical protein